MFQRFHEIKSNQENELMHSTGGESRSSTPGSAFDGRVLFSSHASPLPSQHTSYPSASSPSIMTTSSAMYYGTKYLPSTPPEAHRYSSDSFRVSSETSEQDRYIDQNRISVEPYRQLHGEAQTRTILSDFQRIRVEDHIADTYHRPIEDIYGSPVDLQRVPETSSPQLITAQRIVSELQRIHADGLRSVASDQSSLRHDISTDSISSAESSNCHRESLHDPVRTSSESNYRVVQESSLRIHSDPQRLVQESFKDFFPPPESPKPSIDILSSTVDQHSSIENDRYILAENIRHDSQRYPNSLSIQRSTGIDSENLHSNASSSREIISEDLRTGAHTPQNMLRAGALTPQNGLIETDSIRGILPDAIRTEAGTPQSLAVENIRIGPEASHNMIPENLRLRFGGSHSLVIENYRTGSDVRHVLMPENLRIASNISHNIDSLRGEAESVSHEVMSESLIENNHGSHSMMPENLRVCGSASHNLMSENLRVGAETPHSMAPESLRVGNNNPHSTMPENLRIATNSTHSLVSDHLRFGTDSARNSLVDNLRLVVPIDNHHGLFPDNLRGTSESSRMVPENLCLAETENLHISNSIDHQNGRILTHEQPLDSSLPHMRSHYDSSSHRIVTDNHHSIRTQSPHYSDVYRSDLQDSLNSAGPATPLPPIQMGDMPGTPASQYYTPSSYSSVHNNHYGSYINDDCNDEDLRNGGMSLEEKINRGYQDIKPFDQNYPVPMPLMHMPQETVQPPSSVVKPTKPKKPKEPKPPRLPVIHKCNECQRVFKNSTQLKNHMWRHTGEKPFTCDECGSKFTQQGNLRAHRRIHTGERPYECLECKTCFTQLSTLKTHQKIHSDERPYQCSECDAAFRQIANLKTHQVTHTGERPHQCDLCDKAFTQKSNLKAHKNRVHIGDALSSPTKRGRKKNPVAIKPFICHGCGAKFTMLSNLKIHAKLHSGNKPFSCDYCGAGFAQRSNMKTHIHRMHGKGHGGGRRRIQCDECPAMFRLKRCLKTHKKRRHPIKSLKIKILRESKYLMNSVSPATSAVLEDDDIDDCDDDEDDDDEEGDDYEYDEDDSEEEILESQLLTKRFKTEESIVKSSEKRNQGRDITEPIIEIKEPKVETMDEEILPFSANGEVMSEGKGEVARRAETNNTEEDECSTSSKENEIWEGRFNIKEEIEETSEHKSKDLPLMSSNAS